MIHGDCLRLTYILRYVVLRVCAWLRRTAARCELLRAQGAAGMRDARCTSFAAPDGCSPAAVRCMLHYIYRDAHVSHLPPDKVCGSYDVA